MATYPTVVTVSYYTHYCWAFATRMYASNTSPATSRNTHISSGINP
jgi:hypothetical protein